MIKVNLLKDAGKKKSGGGIPDSTFVSEYQTGVGKLSSNKPIIQRFAFLIVPIIAVYVYTWFVENGLENDKENIRKQITNVEQQVAALQPQLNIIEQLKAEKGKLTTEMNAIRSISRERYGYVRTLDALQTLIPDRAWITKLSVKDQIISLEGRAIEDTTISSFMQNLEESAYFSDVTWIDSKEVTEPQGVVKAFSIRFNLENI